MSTNFSYTQNNSTKSWNGKAELYHYNITHNDNLITVLRTEFKQAVEKKNQKESEKSSSSLIDILKSMKIPVPQMQITLDANEITGLVGEIITEKFMIEQNMGISFYIKWREIGTSKSRGLDIILQRDNVLLIVEAKHSHTRLKPLGNHELILASIIDNAFKRNSDFHTILSLLRLYLRLQKSVQQFEAMHLDISKLVQRANFLKISIKNNLFLTNASLVVDDLVLSQIKFDNLVSKINFKSFPFFANNISVYFVGIPQLQASVDTIFNEFGEKK